MRNDRTFCRQEISFQAMYFNDTAGEKGKTTIWMMYWRLLWRLALIVGILGLYG